MEQKNIKTSDCNINNDQWFSGKTDYMGAHGKPSYYICQYTDKHHYFTDTKTFDAYCKWHKLPLAEVVCGPDCPEFGYCRTCSGFSAIRCAECDIIREE